MACKACGGTVMDAHGACVACGLPNEPGADTQPNGAEVGVVLVATLVEREAAPTTDLQRTADPAATNPGSGVFCGRCGSAVDPLSDFCGICGNPMRAAAAVRQRQERLRITHGGNPLAEADAAETLPPLIAPRATGNATQRLSLAVGIVLIGIIIGVLIWHLH